MQIEAGGTHTMAVLRNADMYTWGEGALGRLGLGFIEKTQDTPNQITPYKIENVFDTKAISSVSVGRVISSVAMSSGTLYSWGKGLHEKMKVDDFQEYSTPFAILEQKQINHVYLCADHAVAISRIGNIFTWGDGKWGALGFGDNRSKLVPTIANIVRRPKLPQNDVFLSLSLLNEGK